MSDRLVIGVMSGTSADGVDAALVRIRGTGLTMRAERIGHVECPYPPGLRETILSIRHAGSAGMSELSQLAHDVAVAYMQAVSKLLDLTNIPRRDIAAIAAHGQTLFHAPPLTMQWIDPALLAYRAGIDVISDFRRADCAAGGQGAPLVPFADYILFRSETENRVILNLGGIANVTILRAGGSIEQVIGFDTGPGNCLSDWLMRDEGGMDEGGARALMGQCHLSLFPAFFQHPYFSRRYPKSTDGPEMISAFRAGIPETLPLEDRLATALGLVVATIEYAILSATNWNWADFQLIAAGGGVRNRALMGLIAQQGATLRTTDELGVPAQAREAMAFAILGAATLDRVPANVVSVTGAERPVVLGAVYPATRNIKSE